MIVVHLMVWNLRGQIEKWPDNVEGRCVHLGVMMGTDAIQMCGQHTNAFANDPCKPLV